MVNSLPVVIYAFDSKGTVLLSEGHALSGMDSAAGAAVGRSVFEIFADEEEVHDHLRRALAGEAQVAHLRLRRNDRTYQAWFTPQRAHNGRIVMVTGLSLDVTEARQVDRELRAAFKSLETIQEHLPIAIFRADAAGTITVARGSILPDRAQESVGRPLAEAYSHYPELVRSVEKAMRGQDQTFSMSDGLRHFDFYIRALPDGESGRGGAIGIIVEVTQQRRAAAAALEAEWRSRFVAEINHELRTPLNSVLGFAQLLTRSEFDPLTDRQRRYLDNIIATGRHLLGLVNELLDLSKLRAGHVDVVRELVDTSAQLEEVAERMMPVAEAKGIALRLGHRSPRPAGGDARRIQQVLLNLVSNAIKFTPPGGQVSLKSHQRHGVLKLEVSDTGIGIASRDQELIFEDFVQLAPGRSIAAGIGLGLALSRRLVRAMGGDLTFRSSVGRGSTFVVSLPVWRESP